MTYLRRRSGRPSGLEMTSDHIRLTHWLKLKLQDKISENIQLKYSVNRDEATTYIALQRVSEWHPLLSRANTPWFLYDDHLLAAIKECPWDLDNQQIAILLGRTTEEIDDRLNHYDMIMARETAKLHWWPMRKHAWMARIVERELAQLKHTFALHLWSSRVKGCPTGYVIPSWADTEEAVLECAGIYLHKQKPFYRAI
ncbi:hypothetical protein V2G26_011367 [Clonostachys chloroleuca]|uniref:Uncharacterized protein n=1 Tax=Clonostachys chloroleuca TaxID=1926264 RepID=A0AA35PYZ1_9HYPO|nr:unnamed protein product [Clonostachys chloroleuca]